MTAGELTPSDVIVTKPPPVNTLVGPASSSNTLVSCTLAPINTAALARAVLTCLSWAWKSGATSPLTRCATASGLWLSAAGKV